MTSDLELLGQFAREKSQDAFTALVNRHVNLAHSAALRQVRSTQLAEEVAQSVFADLARDAGKLKPDTILIAWLYAVTRRTAIDVVRKESRRQLREQIAVEMTDMNATANDWTQIEPLLDDAMAALDETDRSAILLRYFENKNLREVGEALGASDDAAQKRVSRAVERLREFFTKRNVTIGAGGLVALISANAIQAAPIGLAATISAAVVLAGTAVHTSTLIAATKAIAMTTLQKTLVTVIVAVLAGAGIYEARQAAQLRGQNQALQQQQAPLAEQIKQLQRERNEATNRLAGLLDELAKGKSNDLELAELRNEATQFRQNGAGRPTAQQGRTLEWQREQLINAGRATPENTLQTYLWAHIHTNPVELANCLVADATDPPSDEAIQSYVNGEMKIDFYSIFRKFSVTSQTKVSPEEMRLEWKISGENGGFFNTIVLRKTLGEWKMVAFNRRDTYGRVYGITFDSNAQQSPP